MNIGIALRWIYQLGKTTVTSMQITLTTDQPIQSRPRRLPENERTLVQRMVREMLNNGIIQHSNSAYTSPIVLVGKKTGDKRLCRL